MTVLHLSGGELLVVFLIALVGALLQGSIGTGYGLLTAPILHLIDPAFVPAAIVLSQMPLSTGIAVREHEHVDWTGVKRAIVGRIPGAMLGAYVARFGGTDTIALVIASVVLFAVGASIFKVRFRSTPRNVTIAGVVSGFTATSAGIGGPPMALTYQNDDPEVLRGTLGTFFAAGGVMSATLLVLTGVIGTRELQLGALLLIPVLSGLYLSQHTKRRLPAHRVRPLVLTACAFSALALMIETLAT